MTMVAHAMRCAGPLLATEYGHSRPLTPLIALKQAHMRARLQGFTHIWVL